MTATAQPDTANLDADIVPSKSIASSIGFGLSAANWDEGFRIAKTLAVSTLVPKNFQNNPADIVVAMQFGAELGLPPMAALQSIGVVGGKPGLYGDGFLGVIMASPRYRSHREFYVVGTTGEVAHSLTTDALKDDETKAVAMFWRAGIGEPFIAEFSIADAKRAKLWTSKDNWTNYPARMLKWRAREFAGRDAFAAELRGISMVDVLVDRIPDEPTPPPVTVFTMPQRRSERPSAVTVPDVEPDVMTPPAPSPAPKTPKKPIPEPTGYPPMPRPTPPPPTAPPNAPGTGPTVQTADLIITDTAYLTPKDHAASYEVRARIQKPGAAPVAFIFQTTDETLYQLAASAEGTPQPFVVTWHSGKRHDGTPCKILDSIVAG